MKTFQNFVRVLSITSVIFLAKAGVVFITMQGSALAYGGADDYEDSRSLTLGNCGESEDCPEIVVTGYRMTSTDAFDRYLLRESWRLQAMERELCSRVSQREQRRMRTKRPFGSCWHIRLVRGCWSCSCRHSYWWNWIFCSWCCTRSFWEHVQSYPMPLRNME